jgi:hypothetical protein
MHKTEGENNLSNLFTDGPPGTTVEENWLNAVQEEIANAIVDSGQVLKTATTETRDQLSEAIQPSVATFTAGDATPSIAGPYRVFKTDTGGLTITDFDDGVAGKEITVISKGAVTFDTTGTNLVGSSVDLVTASGDVTRWVCEDGTTWRLIAFVDISVDNSAGA